MAIATSDMPDWQSRVTDERDELFKKFTRLDEFVHSSAAWAVGAEQRALLLEQHTAMGAYLDVLNRRILTFGK